MFFVVVLHNYLVAVLASMATFSLVSIVTRLGLFHGRNIELRRVSSRHNIPSPIPRGLVIIVDASNVHASPSPVRHAKSAFKFRYGLA